MINALISHSSQRIAKLIDSLRSFEETGTIPLDCVAFSTRSELEDLGIL